MTELSPRFDAMNFALLWTSFGLGVNEAFNPTLAHALATHTSSVHMSLNRLDFSVEVTPERHDLALLAYLQAPSAKEVFIETCTTEGVINRTRNRFFVTSLGTYAFGLNRTIAHNEVVHAHFSVNGLLEVINS